MIPKVSVKKVMSERLYCLDAKESAQNGAKVMTEHGIGCVLTTRIGEVIGIVTETDLVRKVMGQGLDPKKIPLEEIMSFPPISIDEEALLEDAYKLMGQNQVRHLLVTRAGKPAGIMSARSFMESVYVG